jgi:hypothetical protein
MEDFRFLFLIMEIGKFRRAADLQQLLSHGAHGLHAKGTLDDLPGCPVKKGAPDGNFYPVYNSKIPMLLSSKRRKLN